MEKVSVLIVERDMDTRNRLVQALQTRGFSAWGCPSSMMAMDLLLAVHPSMVMVDLDINVDAGWELLRECKKNSAETRVIMHSHDVDEETVKKAQEEGADAVVSKLETLHPLLGLTQI